ncbi:MAG: type II secretion system inner membrane protein GspF [Bdellovibrionales bacterium]|nr:type II secretion system inner membrane protein GspF [Bdellovibrionales bacterium]
MAIFEYRGLNRAGKNVRGTVEADNSKTARSRLKKDGIFVIDLKDKSKSTKKNKGNKPSSQGGSVGVEVLSTMTRQLASLLKANVPLVDALGAVSEQVENATLSEVMAEMRSSINEGGSFHRGLAKYPKIFDTTYVSMCEAGEMSGTLDVILIRLAEFTEAQAALNTKVRSAMIYPVVMMVFTTLLLGVLSVFVIPKIVSVFESFPEITLPWYTIAVIHFSEFVVSYWHVLIVAGVILYFLFRSWKNTPEGRAQWDALFLKFPLVGKLARMVAVSRFTRTLATLLTGGVPMLAALGIVRNVVNNEVIAKAIDQGRENVSEGESIASPLKKSEQFPPLVIHMISIGEKTGDLENMLIQVSEAYDFQVKSAVDGITSLMEPLMIIIMGCVIAFIVFAIMIPIFELSNIGG